MNDRLTPIFGVILVVLGIAFLILPYIIEVPTSIDELWPIFLLIIGLFFCTGYFISESARKSGILFVGLFLILISIVFFYSTFKGWDVWEIIGPSPVYCLALSFYLTYVIDRHHTKGYLITAYVLGSISLLGFIILAVIFNKTIFISILLILSGILMMINPLVRNFLDKPLKKQEAKKEKK